MQFIQLKKNCKKDMSEFPCYRMALMGDCATQHIAQAIRGYGYEEKLCIELLDTDYNQITAQTADPDSETYRWKPDSVLIAMCSEKLYESYLEFPMGKRQEFAETKLEEIRTVWSNLRANGQGRILQFNFPENDDRVFGNYANEAKSSYIRQLRELNLKLMDAAEDFGNVYLIDLCSLESRIGREKMYDPKLYYAAKMPFSTEALVEIAAEVIRVVKALRGQVKKCIVLDLDNTLWGGVIGDDGLEGIQIGELGLGQAFRAFQKWLKELSKRGVLLTVCSKNDEDRAKEPFLKHPEMVLRLEDIAMFVANWEDKAGNIRKIQETLNLGMDSLLFIDDNPFERNLVRSMIPEITVPELPEDPAGYLSFLQKENYFETVSYSEADQERTRQYREEANRSSSMQQFSNYEEYLQHLEMVAEAKPFDDFHFPRIAQLSQRSNQFNLRTVRYTEEEVRQMAKREDYLTLYFTLRDKFGNHGLISAAVLQKQEKSYFIENWFMSCRVLKRGMEEFIINQMAKAAMDRGAETLVGEYIKTPKNSMVEHIYEKMGFSPMAGQRYCLKLADFKAHKTYITLET